MRIKEVMKKARTIDSNASVKQAAEAMSKHNLGSLIVVKGNKAVGILTERDILSKVAAKDKVSSKVAVTEIMTEKIISIDPEALIDDAVYMMIKHKIKKLPVLQEGEVMGILTSTDIMAHSDEIGQFYFFD